MAINLEHAARKALAELKSMPTEELVTEVLSNVHDPLAVAMRELGSCSTFHMLQEAIERDRENEIMAGVLNDLLRYLYFSNFAPNRDINDEDLDREFPY